MDATRQDGAAESEEKRRSQVSIRLASDPAQLELSYLPALGCSYCQWFHSRFFGYVLERWIGQAPSGCFVQAKVHIADAELGFHCWEVIQSLRALSVLPTCHEAARACNCTAMATF